MAKITADEGCKFVLKDNSSYLVWWRKQNFESMSEIFKQYIQDVEIVS